MRKAGRVAALPTMNTSGLSNNPAGISRRPAPSSLRCPQHRLRLLAGASAWHFLPQAGVPDLGAVREERVRAWHRAGLHPAFLEHRLLDGLDGHGRGSLLKVLHPMQNPGLGLLEEI